MKRVTMLCTWVDSPLESYILVHFSHLVSGHMWLGCAGEPCSMAGSMIRRQRANSQPNLVQYATHRCDAAIQSTLFLSSQRLDPQSVRLQSSSMTPAGNTNPGNTVASSPSTPTAPCLTRQRSHPQTRQQSASLPHHCRLHRQLTPHMSMAHPASPTAASGRTTPLKHGSSHSITRKRSFLLPHAGSPPVGSHMPAMCDSMSTCSGFSSELTNAIEHQSASLRSSIDSRRSNMRRSCSHPNSLDMTRSSVDSDAFGEGACSRSEAAEACSKLSKASCLQYTAAASQIASDYALSIPSCVASGRESDDGINRASEGLSLIHI